MDYPESKYPERQLQEEESIRLRSQDGPLHWVPSSPNIYSLITLHIHPHHTTTRIDNWLKRTHLHTDDLNSPTQLAISHTYNSHSH